MTAAATSSDRRHEEKLARRTESRVRHERRQAKRQERDQRLSAAFAKYRGEVAAIWTWWRSL